jgi:hypothetical protein
VTDLEQKQKVSADAKEFSKRIGYAIIQEALRRPNPEEQAMFCELVGHNILQSMVLSTTATQYPKEGEAGEVRINEFFEGSRKDAVARWRKIKSEKMLPLILNAKGPKDDQKTT